MCVCVCVHGIMFIQFVDRQLHLSGSEWEDLKDDEQLVIGDLNYDINFRTVTPIDSRLLKVKEEAEIGLEEHEIFVFFYMPSMGN